MNAIARSLSLSLSALIIHSVLLCTNVFTYKKNVSILVARRNRASHLIDSLPRTRSLRRNLHTTKVWIHIEYRLKGVLRSDVSQWTLALLQRRGTIVTSHVGSDILLTAWKWQEALENFVTCEGEAELRGRTHDTCWSALEEGLESLLLPDSLSAVA